MATNTEKIVVQIQVKGQKDLIKASALNLPFFTNFELNFRTSLVNNESFTVIV